MTKTDRFFATALLAALVAINLSGLYLFLVHVVPYWFIGLVTLCPISWFGFLFVLSACDPKYRSTK